MSHKIIIQDPKKFRDAIQNDAKLFDAVKRLVERCDADHPEAHHIVKQPFVATSRERW